MEDSLSNTAEVNTSPDRGGGGSLRDSQKGDLKDAAANEGVCVLDLPGELETCGQKSGAPEGTANTRKGVHAGTTDLT